MVTEVRGRAATAVLDEAEENWTFVQAQIRYCEAFKDTAGADGWRSELPLIEREIAEAKAAIEDAEDTGEEQATYSMAHPSGGRVW